MAFEDRRAYVWIGVPSPFEASPGCTREGRRSWMGPPDFVWSSTSSVALWPHLNNEREESRWTLRRGWPADLRARGRVFRGTMRRDMDTVVCSHQAIIKRPADAGGFPSFCARAYLLRQLDRFYGDFRAKPRHAVPLASMICANPPSTSSSYEAKLTFQRGAGFELERAPLWLARPGMCVGQTSRACYRDISRDELFAFRRVASMPALGRRSTRSRRSRKCGVIGRARAGPIRI
jgi:hypothetical protein